MTKTTNPPKLNPCICTIFEVYFLKKNEDQEEVDEGLFKEKNLSMNCRELKGVHRRGCKELVQDSTRILEKLL